MSTASKRSTFLTSNLPPSSANMTQQRRTSDCWLFAALKKHLKVIHITSREEIISRKAWRILHRRVRITCSPLAMWYKTRGTIFRKMRFRNKVHILSYILCLVHFVICLALEMSVWWDVSPNVLSLFKRRAARQKQLAEYLELVIMLQYWRYELTELSLFVIAEKPYWKQFVLLGKWILLFVSHSSVNCWYYLSYFNL